MTPLGRIPNKVSGIQATAHRSHHLDYALQSRAHWRGCAQLLLQSSAKKHSSAQVQPCLEDFGITHDGRRLKRGTMTSPFESDASLFQSRQLFSKTLAQGCVINLLQRQEKSIRSIKRSHPNKNHFTGMEKSYLACELLCSTLGVANCFLNLTLTGMAVIA